MQAIGRALRKMAALGAEVILPGHGLPICGHARIDTAGDTATLRPIVLRITLLGSNPAPRVTGLEELHGKINCILQTYLTRLQ